ncbi:MAG: porin [Bacteroidaceae bacterium]|nr:porin [Bacteroidaceae bacterium]
MKKLLLVFALGVLGMTPIWAQTDTVKTDSPKVELEKSTKKFFKKMDPSIKFGGYIVGKYSVNDRAGQSSNGGFDLRFVRLYLNGYCFQDFYYRLQMEVNGAPGPDKGPRVVDAFVEWQKFDFLRLKLGQFKRSFGFENPYSPLAVGLGSYSQATMKLASINDRIGEHKSSGRDLGFQAQGDLFKAKDGHYWLHYQVGFFNGQGINHADKDNFKDLIGGLWISPIKDLAIGGFGWNGKYTNEKYTGNGDLKSVARKRWGVGMKYESKWTLRGEYMSSVGGVATNAAAPDRSDGWYATLGAPIIKNLKVYGRWDCYRDAKTWSSLKTNYGISANYTLGKNLIFQANYAFTDDRSASVGKHYNTFDIQVYARF